MVRAEIEITDEIRRDVNYIYDQLMIANRLLREINIELQLLRRLAEMQTLKAELKGLEPARENTNQE